MFGPWTRVQNRAYATSQLSDLVAKLRNTEQSVGHRCNIGQLSPLIVQIRQQLANGRAAGNANGSLGPISPPNKNASPSKASKGKGKANVEQDAGPDANDGTGSAGGSGSKSDETPLARVVSDATKLSSEASHGLIGALVKDALFNGGKLAHPTGVEAGREGQLVLPPVVS